MLDISETPKGPSSSSEERSSSFLGASWQRKHESLLFFLPNSEGQLHDFSLLFFSVLYFLLYFLREVFWKKSELLVGEEDLKLFNDPGLLYEVEAARFRFSAADCLFNDLLTKDSHFAAGSLSSLTRTFPAFNGTIS